MLQQNINDSFIPIGGNVRAGLSHTVNLMETFEIHSKLLENIKPCSRL